MSTFMLMLVILFTAVVVTLSATMLISGWWACKTKCYSAVASAVAEVLKPMIEEAEKEEDEES